jgi:biopolymer transport protein ExbB
MRNHGIRIIVALSIVCFISFGSQAIAAEDWTQVADKVEKNQDQSMKAAVETENIVKKDRATLTKELKALKAIEKKEDRALAKLKKQFEGLLKIEAQLNTDLENEQDEIEAVEGTVRSAAKEMSSLSRDNPITPEFPERPATLSGLLESRRFPGLQGIQSLMDVFFQEMAASGTIVRRTGDFVGPDGRKATGEILRIGRFTTFFRTADGSVGFLTPEAAGERLIAVQGEVPRAMQSAIRAYLDRESLDLPVDPSGGGAAFAQFGTKQTFGEWLDKGGILMWPILIVGVVAILLGLQRLITLGTKGRASDKIMEKINDMANRNLWSEAREYCSSKSRIPTCSMLDGVMEHIGTSQDVLENSLAEGIMRQQPKLNQFLPTLSVLAAIAPLLGLLGTVTGMINTFQVITTVGTGDPRMMSGGISEALLTTQFGLMVAVPIMLLHHFLQRRVDRISSDMEEKGFAFIVTIMKNGGPVEA